MTRLPAAQAPGSTRLGTPAPGAGDEPVPAPGQMLGPWRLVEKIGAGGMGVVFRGERADGAYRQAVAVKLLHRLAGEHESRRLASERQILASLELPGMARLYDGGVTPAGHPYLVMELVEGTDLGTYCRQQAPSLQQRLALFLQVCAVVQAAHERLILHCDLKPDNILVRADGSPVLLDFGLAQAMGDASDGQGLYCTPAYASPARRRGEAASVADDVFSLGVMLGRMLAGMRCEQPAEDTGATVPMASLPASAGLRRPAMGELDHVATRACALDPAQRYNSIEALASDIRRFQRHQPVHAHPGGRAYRLRKALRRNWRATAVCTAILALGAVAVANIVQARWQAEQEAAIAEQVSRFLVDTFQIADPLQWGDTDGAFGARQLLDNAAARIDADLQEAPRQRARVQQVLGEAYRNLGAAAPARGQLQMALATLEQLPHSEHERARVLGLLSLHESAGGNGSEAARLANHGLGLLAGGGPPALRAHLLDARGLALVGQQAYDRAEPDFREALSLYAQAPRPDSGRSAMQVRYHLGYMYAQWGRYGAAEREYRQLLAALRGRSPVLELAVTTRLGQTLRWQGRYAEALPLLGRALRQAREIYGADSGMLILQHDALADLLSETGDYAEAERHFAERMRISAAVHGEDSVEYSMGLYNLATTRSSRDQMAGAKTLFRQALAIRTRRLGADAPTTLRAHNGLGLLLLRQGLLEDAGRLLREADAGLARRLPADAPARIESGLALVRLQLAQDDLDAARATLADLAPRIPAGSFMIERWELAGLLAARAGDSRGAVAALGRALAQATAHYGPDKPEVARLRLSLARILLDAGQREAAASELAIAGPVLRAALAGSGPTLADLDVLERAARP